jgi:hypothetical protein
MGTWGHHPWENDSAADWFGDMFDRTKLADVVEETLQRDVEDSADEIRAAAAVLLAFGHTFIWPIKKLDGHLRLLRIDSTRLRRAKFMPKTQNLKRRFRER